MLSKADIKGIKSLSMKKFRDERGLFVVEGEKLVAEAVASDFEVVRILRADEIGRDAMSRISMLSSPSPVLAVVKMPSTQESLHIDRNSLTLALDGLRDPGNVGTIIRLADWFGIRNVIASRDTVDIYNPKVVQATMGAIFRVNFSYCDLPEALAASGCAVYGTYLEGDDIYGAELSDRGIIVLGSESDGISAEVGKAVTRKLTIPSFSKGRTVCESLNVAMAAAVVCSEFRRRI